jgi:hypothetical protein
MTLFIQILSGIFVGAAGFSRIAENPLQGICALFLAGFLIMTGFEKILARNLHKSEIESN